MATNCTFNRRRHERFQLMPMYTTVTAHLHQAEDNAELAGHAYDISESGVRIELDDAVAPGHDLDVQITVPADSLDITASGSVIRCYESDDDPGPRRIAVEFKHFASDDDRKRLIHWLASGHLQRAA